MAAVTLVAPDGQRALPVFTGTEALAAWDPAARPCRSPRPGPARPRSPRAATSSSSTSPARRRACCAPRWSGRWPSSAPGSRRTPTRSSTAASPPPCATRTTSRPTSSRRATPRGEGVLGVVLDLRPGLDARAGARGRHPGGGAARDRRRAARPDRRPRLPAALSGAECRRPISADAVALVTLCVDRPPSPAVCKRSPASTRVDHQVAGSEQVRDALSRQTREGVATASRGGPVRIGNAGSSRTRHEEPFSCPRVTTST